jgi:hypothetical protein
MSTQSTEIPKMRDFAYQLASTHRSELLREASHRRLLREASSGSNRTAAWTGAFHEGLRRVFRVSVPRVAH